MRTTIAVLGTATAILIGVQACGDSVPIPFSVDVFPANSTVEVGGTVSLNATVRDEDGVVLAASGLSWSGSNVSVATVTASGLVTGVAPGTVTITAQAGLAASGTASVTVLAGVVSVDVLPTTGSLSPGQTLQLTATPRDAGDQPVLGASVTWSSSNNLVATVSSTGLVTAVRDGMATITAQSEGVTGTASISVTTVNVRLSVENQLASSVDISTGGVFLGRIAPAGGQSFVVAQPDTLRLTWDLVRDTTTSGTSIGDAIVATFTVPDLALTDTLFFFTIDNVIGVDTIFAPRITNNSGVDLLMGVNITLPEDNRCNCVVSDGGTQVAIGYYRWVSNANVRGYNTGTNYTGGFVFWDRPGMDGFLQTLDGIVLLVANSAPPAPPSAVRGTLERPTVRPPPRDDGFEETLHPPPDR